MPIRSLIFEDIDSGWRLDKTHFQDLNLLVGPSGAGKTRILNSLYEIQRTVTPTEYSIPPRRWTITLDTDGAEFIWDAETELTHQPTVEDTPKHRFTKEKITSQGSVVVDRSQEVFIFQDKQLPRLRASQSAVELLQNEDTIAPLHQAVRGWVNANRHLFGEAAIQVDVAFADLARDSAQSLEALRGLLDWPTLYRAWVLQEDHRDVFGSIISTFQEIFPGVLEVRLDKYATFGSRPWLRHEQAYRYLTVGMKETGVGGWIVASELSAGMFKILMYLFEIALLPAGSTLLVDELENSLGVNCLPEMAEHLLSRSRDIQFIVTSHHPQVINSIPPKHWKLVTRKGSTVTVVDAESIPALNSASPLEKFTQLINLREYEEGVD